MCTNSLSELPSRAVAPRRASAASTYICSFVTYLSSEHNYLHILLLKSATKLNNYYKQTSATTHPVNHQQTQLQFSEIKKKKRRKTNVMESVG